MALVAASAARAEPRDRWSFDLYAFSQSDAGGDPFRAEGFTNLGARTEIQVQATRAVAVWFNATFAVLNNSDPQPVPTTIASTRILAASGQILYLDTSGGLEWASEDGRWVWRPGLYYHHQSTLIAGGADLAVHRLIAGGDARLTFSYGLRLGFRKLRYWDGVQEYQHSHPTPSHTLVLGWTQTLSPDWRLTLSTILARQTGILSNTFSFVTIFDEAGAPRHLVDEKLPTERNRLQLNARLRWSPWLGLGVGLDLSGYADDWSLLHAAIEPSLESLLGGGVRLRGWVRVSGQRAARYFRAAPTTIERFQTQDPDLASFWMLSPGLELTLPLAESEACAWTLRLGAFGFYRSDGIFVVGGHSGVTAAW